MASTSLAVLPAGTEAFDDARGRHWIWIDEAAKRYGMTKNMLSHYHYIGCRWFGGNRITGQVRAVQMAAGYRCERLFLLQSDLEAMASCRDSACAQDGKEEWLTWRQLAAMVGRPDATEIKNNPEAQCVRAEWKNQVVGKRVPRVRRLRMYARSDVESRKLHVIRSRGYGPVSTNQEREWLTCREVMAEFPSWTEEVIGVWRRKGCIYLDQGRELHAKAVVGVTSGGKKLTVWKYLRSDLEHIADCLKVPTYEVLEREDGTYLSPRLIGQNYRLHKMTLCGYRNHCPHLGRPIRYVQAAVTLPAKRHGAKWLYHEGDVLAIIAARDGGGVVAVASSSPVEPSRRAIQPTGRDERTNGNGQRAGAGSESQEDLERLRETLPPLGSDAWVSNKEAAALEGSNARSLHTYRWAGGVHSEDSMMGRDKHGRIWRRCGTPNAHPWYLRSSLTSERDKIRKP